MALGPELKHIAVLEGSLPQVLLSLASKTGETGTADRIQMITYAARQLEIEIETLSPGLLVLGDTYFPGWKAEIDGKEAPVLRTDYLLRGVAVDSGKHRVRFFYCPLSFYIGFGLTVIAGVIILWCLKRPLWSSV